MKFALSAIIFGLALLSPRAPTFFTVLALFLLLAWMVRGLVRALTRGVSVLDQFSPDEIAHLIQRR